MKEEKESAKSWYHHPLFMPTLFLILFSIFLFSVFLFAKVNQVECNGMDHYQRSDILSASGLTIGQRLYGFDKEKIERNILEDCPMIEDVTVTRGGFSSVIIQVTERTPVYYTKQGNSYLYLSDNFYVMKKAETPPTDSTLLLLTPDVVQGTEGKEILFDTSAFGYEYGTNTGTAYNIKMRAVLEALRERNFYSQLTTVDLTNPFSLSATIGNTQLYFGDQNNLEQKLSLLERTLIENASVLSSIEKINVSNQNLPPQIKYFS